MTRSKFIRLSGWSFIIGAVTLFLLILSVYLDHNIPDTFRRLVHFADFGGLLSVWVTPILLGVGLLGLRTRYGDEVEGLGKNILLFGAIAGPLFNFTGAAFSGIRGWGWLLPVTGNTALLVCLSIFGISALRAKPLPRWNSLPILAGVWFPVLVILAFIFQTIGLPENWINALASPAFIAIPVQCVLLVILGYMLQADIPEETPATA